MLRATRRIAVAGWVAVMQAALNTVRGTPTSFHMGNHLLGSRELCSCRTDPRLLGNQGLKATLRASLASSSWPQSRLVRAVTSVHYGTQSRTPHVNVYRSE